MKKLFALTACIFVALISIGAILRSTPQSVPHVHSHASVAEYALNVEPINLPSPKAAASKQSKHVHVKPKHRAQTFIPAIDQPSIQLKHKLIADNALRSLPKQYRTVLKTFRVLYHNPRNRGLAGKTVMILSGVVPDKEFRALFLHEMGHIIDLGYFNGTEESGASNFTDGSEIIWNDDLSVQFYRISWLDSYNRLSSSNDEDFVSGYAMTDPFEDFAETMLSFLLQPEMLRKRATDNAVLQQKLEFMETVVFKDFQPIATGHQTWDGLPWDTTKLPYTWKESNTLL